MFAAWAGLVVALAAAPVRDSDGDRVLDGLDACPLMPGTSRSGCPERDADADGSLDISDHCPEQPGLWLAGCLHPDGDADGVPDEGDYCRSRPGAKPWGCPLVDRDGDGVDDAHDRCPQEVETRNGFEDDDGCDDALSADLARYVGDVRSIVFAPKRAELSPRSSRALDEAAQTFKRYRPVRVEIVGHMPSNAGPQYGKDWSRRRADAVRQALIDRGIAAERLEARGAGGDEPLATNKTAAGRKKNERIEFVLISR